MQRRRRAAAVMVALVLLAAAVPAAAGAERALLGSNVRVSGAAATQNDHSPDVAFDPGSGTYLVVWSDGRDGATRGKDVYGQRLNASGAPVGPNFRVSGPGAVGDEQAPAVTFNPFTNQFLVVWQDSRNAPTRMSDVFGQRITIGGGRFGSNFRITGAAATGGGYSPQVAADPTTGRYLVVWEDGRDDPTRGYDVYGQRLGGAGTRLGGNFRVSGGAAVGDDYGPYLARNSANGQYLVVWYDYRDSATRGTDIYGQRIGAGGARIGPNVRISGAAATGFEWDPNVAYDPGTNRYLVVWDDNRNSAISGGDVYGQRVTATGARVGGNFRVSGPAAVGNDAYADIAFSMGDGAFLVTWQTDVDFGLRDYDIHAQKVLPTGARLGPTFRVSGGGATEADFEPAVAANPAGEWMVVWDDSRNEATRGTDVYGQRVG